MLPDPEEQVVVLPPTLPGRASSAADMDHSGPCIALVSWLFRLARFLRCCCHCCCGGSPALLGLPGLGWDLLGLGRLSLLGGKTLALRVVVPFRLRRRRLHVPVVSRYFLAGGLFRNRIGLAAAPSCCWSLAVHPSPSTPPSDVVSACPRHRRQKQSPATRGGGEGGRACGDACDDARGGVCGPGEVCEKR